MALQTLQRFGAAPRPLTYNPDVPLEVKQHAEAEESYFSGHTSNTAAYSFATAYIISSYTDSRAIKIASWSGRCLTTRRSRHYPVFVR